MPKQRRIIILAGPNGAGKTTFAREYLLKEANCPDFVNVDLIAAGLSPFDPDRAAIRAGRIMLSEIQRRTRKGDSFKDLADAWWWYDNSDKLPVLISSGGNR